MIKNYDKELIETHLKSKIYSLIRATVEKDKQEDALRLVEVIFRNIELVKTIDELKKNEE